MNVKALIFALSLTATMSASGVTTSTSMPSVAGAKPIRLMQSMHATVLSPTSMR